VLVGANDPMLGLERDWRAGGMGEERGDENGCEASNARPLRPFDHERRYA